MRMIPIALVMMIGSAHAEPAQTAIAMLPFDTDAKLEIYSQPVATEVAKALTGGGFDVVVVGAKMVVPERARLVIDGTIKLGKNGAVTLVARVRDPQAAKIDTLVVDATLTTMDHAAEELSSKVLPAVNLRIAALVHKADPVVDKHPLPPQAPALRPMLASVSIDPNLGQAGEPLRAAVAAVIVPWAQRRHHEAKLVDQKDAFGPKAVAAAGADLSVAYEISAFTIDPERGIPMATATVRVRVTDPSRVVFDRVIVTDTVVGDKNITPNQLAERVAREVLQIAEPHLKRGISVWR